MEMSSEEEQIGRKWGRKGGGSVCKYDGMR